MPTMRYRDLWLCLYCAGHLPRSALLTALCTCFGISLQLHQTPCRPHYVPLECELTSLQYSLQKTQSVVFQYLHRFSAVFFTNKHALVLANPHTHSLFLAHIHTAKRDKSKLGLGSTPTASVLSSPPPSLCLAPILEREDLL